MAKHQVAYHPLSNDLVELEEHDRMRLTPDKPSNPWVRRMFLLITLPSLALNFAFTFTGIWLLRGKPVCPDPQILYSPAQDVLEYKPYKFHSGFGSSLPIYDRPPSHEVDKAWEALYEFAVVKIPKSEAVRIPNKTYPILGDESNYMVAIDVFHELHCLNMIRKALYPEHYFLDSNLQGHMGHCISSLRQSLMCSADISTIVWQWSERSHAAKERADVVHSCRDFDKIREWAKEHNIAHAVDKSVYIKDDIQIPIF